MRKYRNDIKKEILMAAGVTLENYEKVSAKNKFNYDPVDEIIITNAKVLRRSLKNVFGLLYECHSLTEAQERLEPNPGKNKIKQTSFQKYMRDSKREMIDFLINDDDVISEIKKELKKNGE